MCSKTTWGLVLQKHCLPGIPLQYTIFLIGFLLKRIYYLATIRRLFESILDLKYFFFLKNQNKVRKGTMFISYLVVCVATFVIINIAN